MIIHPSALILLRTVSLVQTGENRHLIPVREVHVGENVTLKCQISEKTKTVHWLKQCSGYMVQTMASLAHDQWTLSEPFNGDSRLGIKKENNHYLLSIRNVGKEDEATYLCLHFTTFSPHFINSTLLTVKDRCSEKTVKVQQSPETASVQPGESVSLQCSLSCQSKETSIQCPDENSVYWFRAPSEGVISGISDNPKNRSVKKEKRSCVYSLFQTIQSSSDAGTYYCAVFTCGEILFGEGTKVETRFSPHSGSELILIPTLGVLMACCVIVIAVLIFFMKQRTVCDHCKSQVTSHHAGRDQSAVDRSRTVDESPVMTYAALDFPGRKAKRGPNKTRDASKECEYSKIHTGCVSSDSNSQWSALAS